MIKSGAFDPSLQNVQNPSFPSQQGEDLSWNENPNCSKKYLTIVFQEVTVPSFQTAPLLLHCLRFLWSKMHQRFFHPWPLQEGDQGGRNRCLQLCSSSWKGVCASCKCRGSGRIRRSWTKKTGRTKCSTESGLWKKTLQTRIFVYYFFFWGGDSIIIITVALNSRPLVHAREEPHEQGDPERGRGGETHGGPEAAAGDVHVGMVHETRERRNNLIRSCFYIIFCAQNRNSVCLQAALMGGTCIR